MKRQPVWPWSHVFTGASDRRKSAETEAKVHVSLRHHRWWETTDPGGISQTVSSFTMFQVHWGEEEETVHLLKGVSEQTSSRLSVFLYTQSLSHPPSPSLCSSSPHFPSVTSTQSRCNLKTHLQNCRKSVSSQMDFKVNKLTPLYTGFIYLFGGFFASPCCNWCSSWHSFMLDWPVSIILFRLEYFSAKLLLSLWGM